MLECDHEFLGTRDYCLACANWNSEELETTCKHARRLESWHKGQLRKQPIWLFEYVQQKKLPNSVLVTTFNMMNSNPDHATIYNTVMTSKQQFTNFHMEAQAEHLGEIWSAPGLQRGPANSWGIVAVHTTTGAASSSNTSSPGALHDGDPLERLMARVDMLEAKCAKLETTMLAWGMHQ